MRTLLAAFCAAVVLSAPSAAHAASWQYGMLYSSAALGYGWESPDGNVSLDKNLSRFASKLGCRATSVNQLFNCFGRAGWEYVNTFQDTTGPTPVQVFVFKRSR